MNSGSDKSFDLVGLAKAVAALKDLLLDGWDRVRFARAQKADASFKSALEGLSLIKEIHACAEKGALSADEAEKLKRSTIRSVDELLSNGVYTKEMEEPIALTTQKLPLERRKLITHYKDPIGKTEDNDEHDNEMKG